MSDLISLGNGVHGRIKDQAASEECVVDSAALASDFIDTIMKFSRRRKTSEEELQEMRNDIDMASIYKSCLSENALFDSEDSKIKSLVSRGVDVNTSNIYGENALVIMTEAWSKAYSSTTSPLFLGTIKLLLDHGADPKAKNSDGQTALLIIITTDCFSNSICAENEADSLVRMLVEHGADINDDAPLNAAVEERRIEVIRFLLSKGAKVDVHVDGETALLSLLRSQASFHSKRVLPIIKLLLDHGADIKSEQAKFLGAATYNCSKSVECLLEHCYGKIEPRLCPTDARLNLWDQSDDDNAILLSYTDLKPTTVSDIHTSLPIRIHGNLSSKGLRTSPHKDFIGNGSAAKIGNTCLHCSKFEKEAVERQWIAHSPNSDTLRRAILNGCQMCRLIKDCLPDIFGAVSLYYYSTEPISNSRNYYERIIVRCEVPNDFIYGELRLAVIDDEVACLLTHENGAEGQETSSEPSFRIANHWMETCITHHGNLCQALHDHPPTLPTRVIDVSDVSRDPYLLISNGQEGYYATLSYCWGDVENLCTTSISLESFQISIPFQKIPKTIQDAITATRKLGIKYLWVDTLCILQDSEEDWLREAKAMSSIYRNSTLTIAAADSEDSGGGLFRERARLRTRPVQFAPEIAPFSQDSSRERILTFGDRQESNDAFKPSCRLDTRGWVLQEQLLSPRILNFSYQELFWECPSLLASESYPAGIPPDHDRNLERHDFSSLKMMLLGTSSSPNQARAHKLWQQLVVLYSRRSLTYPRDKLVALAGAAEQVSKLLDDTLLVGLWQKLLWRDLLWTVDKETTSSLTINPSTEEFKAPSWSWASTNLPISYIFPGGTSYFQYCPCIQILRYGEKVHHESMNVSGFIELRGAMLPVNVRRIKRLKRRIGSGNPFEYEFKTVNTLVPAWSRGFKEENTSPPKQSSNSSDCSGSEDGSLQEDIGLFGYDSGPELNIKAEKNTSPFSWELDTDCAISGPLQCLIIASSPLYLIFLVLAPTRRRPDEYFRRGLAYWDISKAEKGGQLYAIEERRLPRRAASQKLPDELHFQIITIV